MGRENERRPAIIDNRRRAAGLAGTDPASDTCVELQKLLDLERAINDQLGVEKEVLLRELMQARVELAERGLSDALANAPSPSAMTN
jgi:hypothetical protein